MIDNQVRTSYGSMDASSLGVGPSSRPKARVAAAPAPAPKTSQGPGYTTYVTTQATLLAAQEARNDTHVRRDSPLRDQGGHSQSGQKRTSSNFDAELSEEEQQRVQELKKIDREVRAHERAHRAAGSSLTGAAQFTYTRGPDGQQYAVSGEVSIDTGREQSAAATAAKMEAVIRAALAPANPSSQDIAVAAQARQVLNEVAQEARKERLNVAEDPSTTSPIRAQLSKANQAYRNNGAEDGQAFTARQARNALFLNAQQSFNIII
ncbi:putative metalloprotease CJM1_0395 family protein [Magnetovibrio sp.]|uniref:putative metalloprotease CJM1_0395 family protein n=1 Tax=Magnetovibrio sp. TaxID=2024836 RepID=UPI002F94D0BC